MENRILRTGMLECRVRAKLRLLQHLLEKPDSRMWLMERLEELGQTCQGERRGTEGEAFWRKPLGEPSVSVFYEDELEMRYDQLMGGKRGEEWEEQLDPFLHPYVEQLLQLDGQIIRVDCTGFLVRAIMERPRCREKLERYMGGAQGEECLEACLSSVYAKAPFLIFASSQKRWEARQCTGLLLLMRGEENLERKKAFLSILESGYRRLKLYLKGQEEINGSVLASMPEERNGEFQICANVAGLVMAQEMEIPVKEDFSYCLLTLALKRAADQLRAEETPQISEAGRQAWRIMSQRYPCGDYVQYCLEGGEERTENWDKPGKAGRSKPSETRSQIWDGTNGLRESEALYGSRAEETDYKEVFPVLGMNFGILSGIRLSEEEQQRIFSLKPEMRWQEYLPYLLSASLCKFILRQEEELESGKGRIQEQEAGGGRGGMQEQEAGGGRGGMQGQEAEGGRGKNQKQEAEGGRGKNQKQEAGGGEKKKRERLEWELERLKKENSRLQKECREGGEQLERTRLVLDALRKRQRAEQQELEALKDFVCSMEEEEEEEEKEKGCALELLQRRLAGRRVVVLGGHSSWQNRFRELFPEWMFVAAKKNNYDSKVIRNKEVIIVNTAVLKHSNYYRIMSEKKEGQMVLYVNENNPDRCLRELWRQLESAGKKAGEKEEQREQQREQTGR